MTKTVRDDAAAAAAEEEESRNHAVSDRQAAIITPARSSAARCQKLLAAQSTQTEQPSGRLSTPSSTLQRPKHAETAQQSVVLAGQNRNGYESHQALCHSSEDAGRPISSGDAPFTPPFLPSTHSQACSLVLSVVLLPIPPFALSSYSSPLRSISFHTLYPHSITSIIIQRCLRHKYYTARIATTLALRNTVDCTPPRPVLHRQLKNALHFRIYCVAQSLRASTRVLSIG